MNSVVRVVVSCSDRKRLPAPADLQLRNYPEDLSARATAWIRRLEQPAVALVPAAELYQGEHWAVAQQLTSTGAAVGTAAEVWVASAGYGLLRLDDLVEPYAATFATRADDSVSRRDGGTDSTTDAAYWWRRLAERSRTSDDPATLAGLASAAPSAPLVVALSASYVRAVRRDLEEAAAELEDPGQLLLVSGGTSRISLNRLQVPVDARLQHALGGTRMSLNVRVAKHIIELSPQHGWNGHQVRKLLTEELARQPEVARYERRPMTDAEVVAYIEDSLVKEPNSSCTSLLRRLRDLDSACEQKRFGRLYASVVEELVS